MQQSPGEDLMKKDALARSREALVSLDEFLAHIPDERIGEILSAQSLARFEAAFLAEQVSNPSPEG